MKVFQTPIIRDLLMLCYRLWRWLDKNMHRYIFNNINVWGTETLSIGSLKIKMKSRGDDGIVDAIYFTGSQYGEYEEINLFKSLAQHARVVLDIGANTGLYSIVSQLKNPQAEIYAFEPYAINMKRLKNNAALNGLSEKIHFVEKVLGDSQASVDFAVPESEQISDVLSADVEFTEQFSDGKKNFTTEKIPQVTLDSFINERQIESVDLMKIDVENYELSVLRGALDTLKKYKPVILIEIFVDDERANFYKNELKPLGYQCYMIGIKGLFRTEGLEPNPDFRNYLLCPTHLQQSYLSFSEMDNWASTMMSRRH